MDPNTTLAELRDALATARKAADGDSNDEEIEAWQEVGDAIEALDEWLTNSGFLPADWERENARYKALVDFARALYWDEVTHPVAAAQKVLTDIGEEVVPRG